MNYVFDTYLADEYGVDEAVVIGMISTLHTNRKSLYAPLDVIEIEGLPYVGFDEVDFEQLLPFWSPSHCSEVLDSLEKKGVLVSKEGRNKFYTFSESFRDWAVQRRKKWSLFGFIK